MLNPDVNHRFDSICQELDDKKENGWFLVNGEG